MSDIRGNRMAMIFQEPMTSLNPAYTIGNQLEEALLRHRRASRGQARERAVYLLDRGRHHRGRQPPQAIPPPALRRPAPARDDRHGADVLAVADPGR
jgi:ABC-type microcin C transport system duplicated ATPase subunit YejF